MAPKVKGKRQALQAAAIRVAGRAHIGQGQYARCSDPARGSFTAGIALEHHVKQTHLDLALHRLDALLSDHPAPSKAKLKLYSHAIGEAPLACYAPSALAAAHSGSFPASLADMPPALLAITHCWPHSGVAGWTRFHHRIGRKRSGRRCTACSCWMNARREWSSSA